MIFLGELNKAMKKKRSENPVVGDIADILLDSVRLISKQSIQNTGRLLLHVITFTNFFMNSSFLAMLGSHFKRLVLNVVVINPMDWKCSRSNNEKIRK